METAEAPCPRGPDRRRSARFVLWDRRSGFERRERRQSPPLAVLDTTLEYLRDHPVTVAALLVLGNVLSLADLGLTRISLAAGAVEANPFMRPLLSAHPGQAGAVKIGLILALSLLIWRYRHRRRILGLAIYLVVFYCAIVIHQLAGLGRIL
jgi:hypothetical protein